MGEGLKRARAAARATLLTEGDRVKIAAGHPWGGHSGQLIAYETYGLGWKGWRVRLDEPDGHECYANPNALRRVK